MNNSKFNSRKILELLKITKDFPGTRALDEISFDLLEKEVHAIVGENGAGKSTLIKVITGVHKPNSGQIKINNKLIKWSSPRDSQKNGISAIYQDPTLFPELSVAENMFITNFPTKNFINRVDWNNVFMQSKKILEDLNILSIINPLTKVKELSIAQKQLVEIAKAFTIKSKIIIMDEPTSSLSANEVKNLFKIIEEIKKKNVSVILISHKTEDIFSLADRVSVYRDSKYIITKKINDINKDQLISYMVGREIKELFPKRKVEIGKTLLEVKNLNLRNVFSDISFNIRSGEILGFAGLVGSGRSEIAETIFGVNKHDSGKIKIDGQIIKINSPLDAINLGMGFVYENRMEHGLVTNFPIRENIILHKLKSFTKNFVFKDSLASQTTNKIKDKLKIKSYDVLQLVKFLSGGNQQKVAISKWLDSNAKILIFDEPTKGVDVATKAAIHNFMGELVSRGVAVLMISSELPEILGMSDRIAIIQSGRIKKIIDREHATQENIMTEAIS